MSGRTLNVGDVVLAAFKICGDRWKSLLKLTAVTLLPASVFGALLVATYMPDVVLDAFSDNLDPDLTDAALRAVPSSQWVNLGIAAVVYIVVTTVANVLALAGCLDISLHHHDGHERSHSEALRTAFSKVGPMLWLLFISTLATLVGFVLCIAPGIWLFVVWSVAPVVLLRENMRGTKALGRSYRMVKATFWLVLVVIVLEIASLFLLQTITGGLPNLLLPAAAEANSFAVFFTLSLGGTLAGIVGVALHAAIITELYHALHEPAEPPPAPPVMPPVPPPPAPLP